MKRKSNFSEETISKSHDSSSAEFDVFLSFRGPDTRTNFTDFLYHVLLDKGIRVFIDKKGIDVGEEIGPEIFQAINNSKICIPIFSRGYATSSWCLRELEHMMERRKNNKLDVMPIFYDVEPFDVKLGTDLYRDALTLHEEKRGAEIVQRWAEALKDVTGIRGWDTKNTGHGELTHLIAREVLAKLQVSCVHISDHLVGMDESVNEVENLLDVKSKDIRLIGICGMGGIGKTTLAKVVYQKLSINFDACSFISNIREESKGSGLLKLHRQLVSNILGQVGIELSSIDHAINMIKDRFKGKKVLIFLDDVDHRSQLMALAAEAAWFGLGSRIVVTTRDNSVLNGFQDRFEHCLIYGAKELNNVKALQLFSKHAFRSISPPNAFLNLSKEVAKKTGGLPLTIEVMGSFLYGKKEVVWQDTLKKMKQFLHKDVREKLILSYQALDPQQQQMFLDIACFLAGENRSYADYMWDDAGLFPTEGIEVLLSMSLVKIEEINDEQLYPYQQNILWMHDQLKDLGRSIRYQEMCKDPRNDSRLWNPRGFDMIERKKGTETIAAINWNCDALQQQNVVTLEECSTLPFRFLDLSEVDIYGDFEKFFPELRWLNWHHCTANFEATNFCPKNLLILNLSGISIDEQWGGWTQLKVATRLKVLDLSDCFQLCTTPDLSAYLSLEILILRFCINLVSIDPSIGHLRCLKHLNLAGCHNLQVLPTELGSLEKLSELLVCNFIPFGRITQDPSSIRALMNLECLAIGGASKLMVLPDSIGMLKSLTELDVSGTRITELPNTIVNLKSLKVLKMNESSMQKLPERIGMLEKLERIYGGASKLTVLPDSIGMLKSLTELDVSETRITELPNTIVNLKSLKVLKINRSRMQKLPERIGMLEKLEKIYGVGCKWLKMIPGDIERLPSLTVLKLTDTLVKNVPELPSSLEILYLSSRAAGSALEISNLVRLSHLEILYLSSCATGKAPAIPLNTHSDLSLTRIIPRIPGKINYSPFCKLELERITSLSSYLGCLCCLKELELAFCGNLRHTGQLPSSLRKLTIRNCSRLKVVDLSNLENLLELTLESLDFGHQVLEGSTLLQRSSVHDCTLSKLSGLERMENLRLLHFYDCRSLQTLPNLSNFKNLRDLKFDSCWELVEIKGVDQLESLESLFIRSCPSLRSFPDVSPLKKLKSYWLNREQLCASAIRSSGCH